MSVDKTTTKLAKLRLKEISGVDAAANDTRGWILAKAREFAHDVEAVEKSVVATFEGLASDELDLYLTGAPEDVLKARKVLAEHIAKDITESEEDDTVAKSTESPVAQRITDLFKSEESPEETTETEETAEGAGDEGEAGDEEQTAENEGEQEAEASETSEETETTTGDEGDEPEAEVDEETEETAAGGDEPATTDEADAIAKAVCDAIPGVVRVEVEKALAERDETIQKAADTTNEVIEKALDRLESVEKHLAGQSGLDGQDELYSGEENEGESGLGKAISAAVRNGRVELT